MVINQVKMLESDKKHTKERKERADFYRAMNKSAKTKSMVECKIKGKKYFVGYLTPK